MRRFLAGFAAVALLACTVACTHQIAEFWRPVSEPNILLSQEKAQVKLNYDLSQCKCGIFPTNTPTNEQAFYDPDKQRLIETGVTITSKEEGGDCVQRPSLVVAECMRSRGWEITKCSGRMPIAGGGALCAGAPVDDD
jgi:hypothetical protein